MFVIVVFILKCLTGKVASKTVAFLNWNKSLLFILLLGDQVDDNIPLRVMLLLMDEVFDLKERNQWLRRNIKNLLQQLIRATYGDTINRYCFSYIEQSCVSDCVVSVHTSFLVILNYCALNLDAFLLGKKINKLSANMV